MTKFGRVFKWRKKMIEEKIFDEQGFIKVDPTIPNFFENVFKIDLDIESVKEFKDGTGYKLTTAQYYTPNGDYINKQGIKPNIEEKDKNKQLSKAIEYIKNKE